MVWVPWPLQRQRPYIYTDVTAFRAWLDDNMAERTPSLEGAVDLDGCSGSVVRTDAVTPDDPALMLTNGHCVAGDRPAPGRWSTDLKRGRSACSTRTVSP